jgi:response regulator RpfG family c-di-GMP phosphodiesterase
MTTPPTQLPILLCVDDEAAILKSMQRLFVGHPYQLKLAGSGIQALEIMQTQKVQVIVSDMRMPEMNGAEFLAKAAVLQPDCYRILMTGYADLASTVEAINLGKIHRYVQKPWNNQELLSLVEEGLEKFRLQQANKHLTAQVARQNKELKILNHNLEDRVVQRTAQLKQTLNHIKGLLKQQEQDHKATKDVLYNVICSNPALSGEFALNVSQTCAALGLLLGFEQEQRHHLRQAGLLLELGVIGLPVNLQTIPYYKLTAQERSHYLQHPQYAEEILRPASHLQAVSQAIGQQYEKFNGTGEPQQLIGTDICINARILAVARDFWLFVFQRMSPQKYSLNEALEQVHRQQGSFYDPGVVVALRELLRSGIELGSEQEQQGITKGLSVAELQCGMKLKHNLYNSKKLLLLPKGQELNDATIQSLQRYELKRHEKLQVHVEMNSSVEQMEEE